MDLQEFKKQFICNELFITEGYGRILSIIDFGNVNYWFSKDRQDSDNKALADDEKLRINLEGLRDFANLFSKDVRFYYGIDSKRQGSINFISAAKSLFGRNRVFTKQIQYIRHHLSDSEISVSTRDIFKDDDGQFVKIPKCNFDVEMVVDSIRLLDTYDTLALFSSDADFVALFRFLKKKSKKVILLKGGNITNNLRNESTLVVNAQKVKKYITKIEKQKPGV